jgi:hypothetical protein
VSENRWDDLRYAVDRGQSLLPYEEDVAALLAERDQLSLALWWMATIYRTEPEAIAGLMTMCAATIKDRDGGEAA